MMHFLKHASHHIKQQTEFSFAKSPKTTVRQTKKTLRKSHQSKRLSHLSPSTDCHSPGAWFLLHRIQWKTNKQTTKFSQSGLRLLTSKTSQLSFSFSFLTETIISQDWVRMVLCCHNPACASGNFLFCYRVLIKRLKKVLQGK